MSALPPEAPAVVDDGDMPKDAPWWARWLAAEWRNAGRWLSTYLIGAAAAAPIAYDQIETLKAFIPPNAFHYIETGLVLLIFLNNIRRKPEPK